MLHHQRRLAAERDLLEAAGESFWTENFVEPARVQILHIVRSAGKHGQGVSKAARQAILIDEGQLHLAGDARAVPDFESFILTCHPELMPSVIEAWIRSAARRVEAADGSTYFSPYNAESVGSFTRAFNEVLLRHRISFELIDGQMVDKDSQELHADVVAPVLKLLASSDGLWARVEKAYSDALAEIGRGEAANAITDAGTALQEALTAAGADGNSLGPLISSARKKGLIAGHDTSLGDSIAKAMDWVSSDRSQNGDAHHATDAVRDDAWLIVHVAGALILRLNKGSGRGQ